MRKAVATKAIPISNKPGQVSLWDWFDAKHSQQLTHGESSTSAVRRMAITILRRQWFRWVVDAALPFAMAIMAGIAVQLPTSLPDPARLVLFAFLFAVILWSTTSISADYIALLTVMILVLTGGASQEALFNALASDVVWLMIGAYVLGGAVQKAGLASRLTQFVVSRVSTVRELLWSLTIVLIPLAFLIPSTSGRAAVTAPIFHSITAATNDRRVIRAIALLMPTIILVSTIVALVGAGSHLVANDLLYQITGQRISFAQWTVYGLPFGIAASVVSCWVIMHLFLDQGRRQQKLKFPQIKSKPFSRSEWLTLAVVAVMMGFWLTERWHGFEIATVTMVGVLVLTLPGVGVLKWKDGIKVVSWNLVIFVGAAFVLGQSLIDSGAAQWLIDGLLAVSGIDSTDSLPVIMVVLTCISLTSHLYMTSHTARAAALIPVFLYLANSIQLNPVAVVFFGTVGMDYCLTFPVSSKALLIFQDFDGATYKPTDLLRLSAVLMPVHLGLMVLFYFTYWQWVGLSF